MLVEGYGEDAEPYLLQVLSVDQLTLAREALWGEPWPQRERHLRLVKD